MLMAKTSSRASRAFSQPIIVMISYVQMPLINSSQSITVADEGALPVVVEIVPGHRDPIASTDNIALAIVIIWTSIGEIARREFVVVNPDAGAVLDGDAIVVDDIANTKVPDNDIGCICNCQACTGDFRYPKFSFAFDDSMGCSETLTAFANSNDRLVASNPGARSEIEGALGVNNSRFGAIDSREEFLDSCNSDLLAVSASTTGSWPQWVIFGKTNKREIASCWCSSHGDGEGNQREN